MKVVAVLTVAALFATGCQKKEAPAPAPSASGAAAVGADQILERARHALNSAKSFHLAIDNTDTDGHQMVIDFKVAGEDLRGWCEIEQARVEMLAVGGIKYVKPNEAWWTTVVADDPVRGRKAVATAGDRWVRATDENVDVTGIFFMADLSEVLKPNTAVTLGPPTEVDGVPAITLTDGSQTFYVAATGEPYPIAIGENGAINVRLTEFGAAFPEISQPAPSDIVDYSAVIPT
ncbi:hypothetical protein [Actinoplanes sp. NPDC026619]|uniref:hypothetical protein n=1 Tax=Actinoplanes sp. NPDC026619 TaxID=3155798 RepID=UPI0033D2D911